RSKRDWSSDVCSSDLIGARDANHELTRRAGRLDSASVRGVATPPCRRPRAGAALQALLDARAGQIGLAFPQAHVAGHRPQAELRRDGGNHGGPDGAAVESIVLDDDRGPPPARFGALAGE